MRGLLTKALILLAVPMTAMAAPCPGYGPNGEGVEMVYPDGNRVKAWPKLGGRTLVEGRDKDGALTFRQEMVGWLHTTRLRRGDQVTTFEMSPDPATTLPLTVGQNLRFKVQAQMGNSTFGLNLPARYQMSVEITEAITVAMPDECSMTVLIAKTTTDAAGRFVTSYLAVMPSLQMVFTGAPDPITPDALAAMPKPLLRPIGRR